MVAFPAKPMDLEREHPVRPQEPPSRARGPAWWTAWVRPLLVSALALLAASFVAELVEIEGAKLAHVDANESWDGSRMPARVFLLRALGTDAGLLVVGGLLLSALPGRIHLRVTRRALLVALAGFLVLFSVNLAASWGMKETGEVYGGLPEIPRGAGGLALVLAAAGIAPAAEELFFREALLSRVFAASPRAYAVGVTSLAFGALHLNVGGPLLFLALSVMGIVLGLVRLRTGSLGTAILVHAVNNLSAILLALGGGT